MALNIPKVVEALFVSDPDATRVRDGLSRAIQPVLNFLNAYFSAPGDGTLHASAPLVVPSLISSGPLAGASLVVNGTSTLNGPLTANGLLTANGNLSVTGTAALAGPVTSTTSFGAPSFVSGAGFKSFIPMGHQYRQTQQSGIVRCIETTYNVYSGTVNWAYLNRHMDYPGSIVGISLYLSGSIAASMTVQVFKNNFSGITGQIIDTGGVAANAQTPASPITFAKGQYPFAAGDTLGMGVYVGSGYSTTVFCGLIVEFGA